MIAFVAAGDVGSDERARVRGARGAAPARLSLPDAGGPALEPHRPPAQSGAFLAPF